MDMRPQGSIQNDQAQTSVTGLLRKMENLFRHSKRIVLRVKKKKKTIKLLHLCLPAKMRQLGVHALQAVKLKLKSRRTSAKERPNKVVLKIQRRRQSRIRRYAAKVRP